jgi:hypothetical protein
MTRDELVVELCFHIDDLEDTIYKSEAVRSFVEQSLLAENDSIDDQVSLIYSLIQKSEEMSDLIDEFLDSPTADQQLVDKANKLVSQAKTEIARFQDARFLVGLNDVSDETETVQ